MINNLLNNTKLVIANNLLARTPRRQRASNKQRDKNLLIIRWQREDDGAFRPSLSTKLDEIFYQYFTDHFQPKNNIRLSTTFTQYYTLPFKRKQKSFVDNFLTDSKQAIFPLQNRCKYCILKGTFGQILSP